MNLAAEEARKIFGEYVPGDWSEDTMQKIAIVLREPVGVVLAISPFNYPLFITSAKVVPALLAGDSVVVKLPSADPITFLLFTRMLEEAGLPPGSSSVRLSFFRAFCLAAGSYRHIEGCNAGPPPRLPGYRS